ncbi:MAG: hypothetical protein Q9174_002850 [Haloplaca sp. 1 TL-2023]
MASPIVLRQERSAAVLYGSETGNAVEYAEEAERLLRRSHFKTVLSPLDHFEPVALSPTSKRQGDLPGNARSFWKNLLRKKLPPDYLGKVNFTTFGLGDSSYPKFNWAARKLHKRLLQLGAFEFYPRGEADEQHDEGLDAAWLPWSEALRHRILLRYPLEEGIEPVPEDVLLQPRWLLDIDHEQLAPVSDGQYEDGSLKSVIAELTSINGAPNDISTSPIHANGVNPDCHRFHVKIEENRRLTPSSHWQDVRHLRLSSTALVDYSPGDVLTIHPHNSSEDVEEFLAHFGWNDHADQPLKFVPSASHNKADIYSCPPFTPKTGEEPLTLRKLLVQHLDIRAIPRRSFFSTIAHFTNDQTQKERLLEFTDPKYLDELYDYTTRPRRSILEVLQEFDTVQIPWQWAVSVLPELRGRQFSIASGGSLKYDPDGQSSFDLLVAIVKYKTVIKRLREGVCTRYLAGLSPGTELLATLQKGGLSIRKAEARLPVIMIGPGTGLAPMRSLIWERRQWHEQLLSTEVGQGTASTQTLNGVGETVLFFGGRNKEADFFYEQEWKTLENSMPLQVFTAFSRDQTAKVYVQDVLKHKGSLVYDLLFSKKGLVYVCGSSGNMPKAVRAALVDVFKQCGSMDEPDAETLVQTMEKEGRYKQETW